ncbi:hypothetical protein [Devosia psychrophila]|uniref:hypothetical protein n=1 Tax=Devosia psychrophila TaxID=728005 RepID=UPI00116016A2|nr:hypothetical protein [Devosia psychrophila]
MFDNIIAVTALYDIGRGGVGRPIEQYIGWLNATLRLPVRFTVFLDPSIELGQIHPKPGDRLVQVPIVEWYPMRWEEQVDRIGISLDSQDLTFTLPRYALLVMSKFDMLKRVAVEEGDSAKMLWVDAGLSRFFRQDMADGLLSRKWLEKFRDASFAASPTPWGLKQIRKGRVEGLVGTSPRLVTGGDLYMTGAGAVHAAQLLHELVEQRWLPNNKWDNEQVAMGQLLADGWPGFKSTKATREFASIVADLFSLRTHRRGIAGQVDHWFEKLSKTRA